MDYSLHTQSPCISRGLLTHLVHLAGIPSENSLKLSVENASQTRTAALDRISNHMSRSIGASAMFDKAFSLFEKIKSTY